MWFGYRGEESNWIPITVDRVQEVLALNAKGERPQTIDGAESAKIELELEKLNSLLFQLETIDSFCIAHEIFDITKHKVVYNRKKIVQMIHQPELKPFQFICNKN